MVNLKNISVVSCGIDQKHPFDVYEKTLNPMKKYFLMLIVAAISHGLQAQYFPAGGYQGGTHGNVTADSFNLEFMVENQAGNPIMQAVITVGGQSNPQGDYLFENMEAGVYSYQVSAPGYEDAFGSVLIDEGDVTLLVVLTAMPGHFLDLVDVDIGPGMVECYYAAMVITVAGEGHFFVAEAGSSTTLIAGESIRLLPGTHIKQAAYFHAYIGTDACPPPMPAAVTGKDVTMQEENTAMDQTDDLLFRVYPNPTTGMFTVEFVGSAMGERVVVEVLNLHGSLVQTDPVPPGQRQLSLNLMGHQPGVYLIRAMADEQHATQRIILR